MRPHGLCARAELLELCELEAKVRSSNADPDAFRAAFRGLLSSVYEEPEDGDSPVQAQQCGRVLLASQPARQFAAQLLADNQRRCAEVDEALSHLVVEALVELADCLADGTMV